MLAGGGTKGSFEIGVLQYLVGVEGIVPDIISATSAGAIVATVLAQARRWRSSRTRVDEIERDLLAWSESEHVFGKQPWLRALEGTASVRPDRPRGYPGYPSALPPDTRPSAGRERCRPFRLTTGP